MSLQHSPEGNIDRKYYRRWPEPSEASRPSPEQLWNTTLAGMMPCCSLPQCGIFGQSWKPTATPLTPTPTDYGG